MPTKNEQAALKVQLDAVLRARDHFEMLGVHKGSTAEEISEARGALARVLHPDRWGQDARRQKQAGDAMASVNQAHTVLTTKALRTRYVAELASGRSKCPACHGEGYTSKQRGFTKRENLRCTTCGGSGLHKER